MNRMRLGCNVEGDGGQPLGKVVDAYGRQGVPG